MADKGMLFNPAIRSQGDASERGINTSRLARLLAGLQSPAPPPVSAADFAPKFPPFTGLRNEPAPQGLPPFAQPGALPALSMGQGYGGPEPAPGTMPQAAPMQPPPVAPQAQPWLALNDQSRTAAFDPLRDMSDPNNVHMVDEFGRVLPQMGPWGKG